MRKKLLWVAGGVVVLVILVMIALSVFVDVDQFRPEVEKQATQALGRQLTIGKLRLALFSGGISAEQIVLADDPKFSKDPFLTAKSMTIGADLTALIFHKKLAVNSFTIHSPQLTLIELKDGKWNFSSLAKSNEPAKSPQAPASSAPPDFSVGSFVLDDGQVTIRHLAAPTKSSVYTNLRLEASNVSLQSAFPFKASATPPGGGSLSLEGTAGPLAQQSERTPLTADVKVRDFDLGKSGFNPQNSPIRGQVDLDMHLASDGTRADVTANVTGKKLCLVAGCSPADAPIAVELKADYDFTKQLATLRSGQLKIVNSVTALAGTIDMHGDTPRLNMRAEAGALAVNDLVRILPAVGVIMPSGAKLEGGTASLKATATGLTHDLVTAGHVSMKNSRLTGYNLGGELSAMGKLVGLPTGSDTDIQELSADFQVTPQGSKLDNILLILPAIGKLTGNGTIGAQNELNFPMKAELDMSHSAVGKISSVLGRKSTTMQISFHVTGTTSKPKFMPDALGSFGAVGGDAAGALGGVTGKVPRKDALGNLGGMFGKKKK